MVRHRAVVIPGLALVVMLCTPAWASDTPHGMWIRAKCAVCHGDDGSGDTPQGKQRHVPDLRSPEIQKLTNDELADIIQKGHGKMPSFVLTKQQIDLLVMFIRGIARR